MNKWKVTDEYGNSFYCQYWSLVKVYVTQCNCTFEKIN